MRVLRRAWAALLGTTAEVAVASGSAAGWRNLAFALPVSLPAGTDFLGVHVGGADGVIRDAYDMQAGIMRYDGDAYGDGPANPYGPSTTYGSRMSLFATYVPGAPSADTTPPTTPGNFHKSGASATDNHHLVDRGHQQRRGRRLRPLRGGALGTATSTSYTVNGCLQPRTS